VLCGGEPTIATHFAEVIREIHQRWPGAAIDITTNGTVMSDNLADFLKEHRVSVQISLDGSSPESHDFARGTGSFKKILDTTLILQKKEIPYRTLTVLSKRTMPEISGVFALSKSIGASKCNFRRLIISGRAKNLVFESIDGPLSPDEMHFALKKILESSTKYGIETNTNGPLWVLIDKKLGCHSGFGFLGVIIDSEGYLKVSGASDYRVADLRIQRLESVFLKHPLFVSLRKAKIKGCGECSYLRSCGGDRSAAYVEFGDFLGPDPACWYIKGKMSSQKPI
jgi:MoaA/NifB/PqqE/SkfB family radical SAM enzyme